jgi:hypothetical protein
MSSDSNHSVFVGIGVQGPPRRPRLARNAAFSEGRKRRRRREAAIAKRLHAVGPTLIVLEATGGLEAAAAA